MPFLRVAVDLGQHEVVGPGLLHRIINEIQRRSALAAKTHCGPKRIAGTAANDVGHELTATELNRSFSACTRTDN